MESKGRDERDDFRRKLKEEWRLIWTERFDDRLKAEGIAVRDYPMLFTDRGSVIFASRAVKTLNFSEIAKIWASMGEMYSPDSSCGGWGKFIRTEIKSVAHSRALKQKLDRSQPSHEIGQAKKGGRGWLHVK